MNETKKHNSIDLNEKLNKENFAYKMNEQQWNSICHYFRNSFKSTPWIFAVSGMKYCSIATVNHDGTPHVMPFASLFVNDNRKAYYFEPYSRHTSQNLKNNQRLCVMVVNNGKWFLLKTLFLGKSSGPIAMRLMGSVGEKRKATAEALLKWHKLIRFTKPLKGARETWFKMDEVLDIYFNFLTQFNLVQQDKCV